MIADILRDHFNPVGRSTFWDDRTWQALRAITRCHTAACGYHVERCQDCGTLRLHFNSCRDRHCPLCQGRERAAWTARREADVLPVPYFHVVCTMPHDLLDLVRWAPATCYNLLHAAATETVNTLMRDPSVLGAQPGMISVLHTWASDLGHHPHIHMIVPAGGRDPVSGCWLPCRYNRKKKRPFLVAVNRLRAKFTATLCQHIMAAHAAGHFEAEGTERGFHTPPHLTSPRDVRKVLSISRRQPWVVYIKRPFGDPRVLIRYLARYTHRTAIAPGRITAYDGQQVTFLARVHNRYHMRPVTMPAQEFTRRFALHVLPRGFHRIRHCGFLANAVRQRNVAAIRAQLAPPPPRHVPPAVAPALCAPTPSAAGPDPQRDPERQDDGNAQSTPVQPAQAPPPRTCPHCGGLMYVALVIPPGDKPPQSQSHARPGRSVGGSG